MDVFKDLGNPFAETSAAELINIFNKTVAEARVISDIRRLKEVGLQQFEQYVNKRILSQSKSTKDPMKMNRLQLLASRRQPTSSKAKAQLQTTKTDCSLFSRLYIACQSRGANLEEFFSHENHAYPPSLAVSGQIRTSNSKSDFLPCLLEQVQPTNEKPTVTCVVFDGAAVCQMVPPKLGSTFSDHAKETFLPFVLNYMATGQRIDVVFDRYLKESLKETTREKRGTGIMRRVQASGKVPRDWKDFLKNDENKADLFRLLAREVITGIADIVIVTTFEDAVLSNQPVDQNISPCQQEEADTRMLLHVANASLTGHDKIMIRTVDTDVVVLSTALFANLVLEELWIAFGSGKNFKHIPVREIASILTPEKSLSLLFFHAFSGSDSTSAFLGIGKRTAWTAWKSYPEITSVFRKLSDCPPAMNDTDISSIEKFTVHLYDKNCTTESINTFRKDLFSRKGRAVDRIPPTRHALIQHVKRSAFIAGHIGGSSLTTSGTTEVPTDWGWVRAEGRLTPFWTDLPEISKACKELIKCGCRKGCKTTCMCKKASLPCTELCYCGSTCDTSL